MNRRRLMAGISGLCSLLVIAQASAQDDSLQRIKAAGQLVIGSTSTGVPTTFLNPQTGEIQGIMVDVARSVADRLGLRLKVVETPWASLIPSLQGKKIDLIAAAMYITEKRKEVIDFSVPVYPYCETLVVAADNPGTFRTLDDLKGMTVAGQVGTVYIDGLQKHGGFKDVKVYDSIGDILLDITHGRVQAGVVDGPVAAYLVKTKPEFKARLSKDYRPTMCGEIGIGIRKEDKGLLAEINTIVEQMKARGEVEKILAKWGL